VLSIRARAQFAKHSRRVRRRDALNLLLPTSGCVRIVLVEVLFTASTNFVLLHRGDYRISDWNCGVFIIRGEPEGLVDLDAGSATGKFASPCACDLARARGLVSVSDETTPRPCALSAFA